MNKLTQSFVYDQIIAQLSHNMKPATLREIMGQGGLRIWPAEFVRQALFELESRGVIKATMRVTGKEHFFYWELDPLHKLAAL
jgi:hypothetical protein